MSVEQKIAFIILMAGFAVLFIMFLINNYSGGHTSRLIKPTPPPPPPPQKFPCKQENKNINNET